MDVWVLEQSLKDVDAPLAEPLGTEVFSTRERALEWVAYAGERVRWRYSKHNPDWQKGSTLEGRRRTHFLLYRTGVDDALLEEEG